MSIGLAVPVERGEIIHSPGLTITGLGRIRLDERGLHCDGVPTLTEFAQVGQSLTRAHRMLAWWIGDWFNAGEQYHGENFAQLLDHTALDPATVTQYAWVARQVSADRRCPALSFSHHREVADLTPDEQYVWLSRAEDAGYSSHRLRRELAKQTRGESRLWVLVAATSPADAETFCARCVAEGRAAKVIER